MISRIAEHDIGIAFEETSPPSRNFTITNKIFHYLQAGIGILATKTKGQTEVHNLAPDAIWMLPKNPLKIAQRIDLLLSDLKKIESMKTASWEAGKEVFAFEKEAKKLMAHFEGN